MIIGPTQWVKSSYSSPEGGNCLEWAPTSASTTGIVPVRDSKTPQGPVLAFPAASFATFIAAVKGAEFSN
ncbi:hypothetical protein ADL22_09770 [Streptomyces sp. NRRL F-4489]|uniref:DUF397 domain-containing protein n=1 Tax=Streptomyces sp. NRRL F-4489 TaxID=1609095 RepID=UPI000749EA0E|nr:DUF397 domain-containing protein [Streptomyces sp. NRRL F-4489]KUL47865.1 hypothetical protein ADL22_09770 [Streptomyces sp. NRRL F-4489]